LKKAKTAGGTKYSLGIKKKTGGNISGGEKNGRTSAMVAEPTRWQKDKSGQGGRAAGHAKGRQVEKTPKEKKHKRHGASQAHRYKSPTTTKERKWAKKGKRTSCFRANKKGPEGGKMGEGWIKKKGGSTVTTWGGLGALPLRVKKKADKNENEVNF